MCRSVLVLREIRSCGKSLGCYIDRGPSRRRPTSRHHRRHATGETVSQSSSPLVCTAQLDV